LGIEIFAGNVLEEPGATWRASLCGGWLWHEFAHAMHDQILGLDHSAPKAAYAQARERKLYAEVEICDYGTRLGFLRRGPAYALRDHKACFAEISMACFGQNKRQR